MGSGNVTLLHKFGLSPSKPLAPQPDDEIARTSPPVRAVSESDYDEPSDTSASNLFFPGVILGITWGFALGFWFASWALR